MGEQEDAEKAITKTIDAVISHVPPEETSMHAQLRSIRESMLWAAPEMDPYWWNQMIRVLARHLPTPTLPWHHAIVDVIKAASPKKV